MPQVPDRLVLADCPALRQWRDTCEVFLPGMITRDYEVSSPTRHELAGSRPYLSTCQGTERGCRAFRWPAEDASRPGPDLADHIRGHGLRLMTSLL
jgi:hypothetical protein